MSTVFRRLLHEANPSPGGDRRWVYVPYDQLTDRVGPLAERAPGALGIVMVESTDKPSRRPYHKGKLALVLTNQRHFALEQARRGVAVRYEHSDRPYAEVLAEVVETTGPLTMMRPAERELRVELAPLVADGRLVEVAHAAWLTHAADFDVLGSPPWRMDAFYRQVRRRTGLLMVEGKPEGGRFSHDGDNRKPWRGDPPAPTPPRFAPDPITAEVGELVRTRFADHPGTLQLDQLPATAEDATRLWTWAMQRCMPSFGPYEDAMSVDASSLFHTRISPLLNLCRLLPAQVVDAVAAADLPLSSREGFVRQVLGWREFVRHVHERTDGLRALPAWKGACPRPGEGRANHLGATDPLPAAWWGRASGLGCLDHVVRGVWEEGWSHHITRLMVLSNLAVLLEVDPEALNTWFWVAYLDAYDWVVEPNVLGMGTFSVGDLMTTKPYISGSAYLHRMSDYCRSCRFDPKKTCPITPMYWAFLERHATDLQGVQRIAMPLRSMAKRSDAQRAADRRVASMVRSRLAAGEVVLPEHVIEARQEG